MMYGKKMFAIAAVCAVSQAMTATAYGATSDLNMKRKAISMLGIMSTATLTETVSRADFARMLVRASEYRTVETSTSNVSVYADVLSTSEYASPIRIAAQNGWMSGFLGGNFKPEQGVTVREAARALLALLGYQDSDFAGNISENRMAKFVEVGLGDDLNLDQNTVLTKMNCMYLFYNLMSAKTKSGMQYGSQVFDLKFTTDGEIDLSSINDNSLTGPKLLINGKELDDVVPFSLKKANLFLNGYSSDEDAINRGDVMVYYDRTTKTVFAYSVDYENKGYTIGEIESIYYDSEDLFSPVSITLDDGEEYRLESSGYQYLFSIYGKYEVGDEIVVIWEKSGGGENASYKLIDVFEEDEVDD